MQKLLQEGAAGMIVAGRRHLHSFFPHLRISPGSGARGSLVKFATITANAANGETFFKTAAPRDSSRGSAPFPPTLPEASWKAVMQEALRRRRATPLFSCPSLPAGGVGVVPRGVPSLAAGKGPYGAGGLWEGVGGFAMWGARG